MLTDYKCLYILGCGWMRAMRSASASASPFPQSHPISAGFWVSRKTNAKTFRFPNIFSPMVELANSHNVTAIPIPAQVFWHRLEKVKANVPQNRIDIRTAPRNRQNNVVPDTVPIFLGRCRKKQAYPSADNIHS